MSGVNGLPERTDILIRAASDADVDGIAAVHIRSWLATYPHLPKTRMASEAGLSRRMALWSRRLRQGQTGRLTFVAVNGRRICGFVHLGPSPDPENDATGQVFSIHVEPDLAGGGIGGRLMATAVTSLRAAGYSEATLWVVADNYRARGFYERLGWQLNGSRRRELLAIEGEEGDEVEVVRYRLDLDPRPVKSL